MGQTIECLNPENLESVTISNIVCNDNGTPDNPDDDYFSFTVTANIVNTSVFTINVPPGTTFRTDFGELDDVSFCDGCDPPEIHVSINAPEINFPLELNSPGCNQVDFLFEWNSRGGDPGFEVFCSGIITIRQTQAIPVLSTWAFIVMALAFSIVSIVTLRRKFLLLQSG